MNTDILSYNFDDRPVRVVLLAGEPWFVANDLARVLEYRHTPHMIRMLSDHEKGVHLVDTLGGQQEMTVVSEAGMWKCVFRSKRKEAQQIVDWIAGEVLPSIRKTGRYVLHDEPDPPQLPSPALDDANLSRITAAIGVMKEARHIWGREECRRIWISVGLPSPIAHAEGEEDELAERVAAATADVESVIVAQLARELGMKADARSSLRLGAVLRLLGWESRKEWHEGRSHNVWRRIPGLRPVNRAAEAAPAGEA